MPSQIIQLEPGQATRHQAEADTGELESRTIAAHGPNSDGNATMKQTKETSKLRTTGPVLVGICASSCSLRAILRAHEHKPEDYGKHTDIS